MNRAPRLSPRILILGGAALGLLMISLAVGWITVVRGRVIGTLFPGLPLGALAVGGLAGATFATTAWLLFRRTSILRSEVAALDRLIDLTALRWYHVVIIALVAAVPEELLFRGALLPEVGLLVSALVFGLAHAISLQYALYAGLAGLLCGLLMVWTGGLWAPMSAHAVIDSVMFALLIRRRPSCGWYVREAAGGRPS